MFCPVIRMIAPWVFSALRPIQNANLCLACKPGTNRGNSHRFS